jgi:hypothetical protein
MLKSVRALLVLATFVLAAALPSAGAANDSRQVTIETNAQWGHNFLGVDLQLHVRCDGGMGFVNVQVSQSPPENQFPTQGFGGSPVSCNGQQQQVGVTVNGMGFDIGKAFAFAQLFTPAAPAPATATKTINITF